MLKPWDKIPKLDHLSDLLGSGVGMEHLTILLFGIAAPICCFYMFWPKYDLEMKVMVKSPT
jgi:hypothetical protein